MGRTNERIRPLLSRPKPHAPKCPRQTVRGPRGLLINANQCTHALSSHPLMMHLPGEIEPDESTDAQRVVLARSSRAATSRGNGSRGGVSRSIVRMVREHARRITRATFSKPHHPDWVSLEAPPSTRKNRPPRTPLKPTFQNDKSLIDTQSASLCPSVQSLPNVSYRCATRQAAQGQGRSRFAVRA